MSSDAIKDLDSDPPLMAVTVACEDRELGEALMLALADRTFRVYWTDDVRAVHIGGAVKNVLAIAAGIVEGRIMGPAPTLR